MKNTPQQLQRPVPSGTGQRTDSNGSVHIPVLLEAALNVLKPQKGEKYLDLTAGYAGHARAVIDIIGAANLATLVDRDKTAIEALETLRTNGAEVIHSDYHTAAVDLKQKGRVFDMVLLDLGVSSPQLDVSERGFSFLADGPLDMRMDQSRGQTAADIVNKASRGELMKLLRDYGEEWQAPRLADAIIGARPLTTTGQLARVIEDVYRGKRGKIHPATQTFQALRIAVNDELGQLKATLPLLPDLLEDGGRLAIISFHSLEDRLVKQFFKEQAEAGYEATLRILTRSPISGQTEEAFNPRARSAKLRAAVKINTKNKGVL